MDDKLLNTTLRDWLPAVQGRLLGQTRYFGVPVVKCPLDWWIYQELVCERRPDAIIEIGNFRGGMLLALAHWCDALGHGVVFGVDIDHSPIAPAVRRHNRIRLVTAMRRRSVATWLRRSLRSGLANSRRCW